MSKQELLKELFSLPVEERVEISDKLNQSLNPISQEAEQQWLEEVEKRKEAYQKGEVNTLSYEEFFS